MADVNKGIAPVDLDSLVGQFRLALGDTDATAFNPDQPGFGSYTWYSDAEIEVLVAQTGDDPRMAAAGALRMIAVTPAMKLKKWSSADLAVDGPAITTALLKVADSIEASIANAGVEFFKAVPTGAAVAQPAFVPDAQEYRGIPIDPTIPRVI